MAPISRVIAIAWVVLLACVAARGETIHLRDGRVVTGKVLRTTDKVVEVRTAPHHLLRIDKRLIYRIYKDGEKVPPPPKPTGNPAFTSNFRWPEPFDTIPVEREEQIARRVDEILAASDAAGRRKLYDAAPAADRALLPTIETIERWLAQPARYPGAVGVGVKGFKIDLPWQGENERAIALLAVPKDYDPCKKSVGLLFALHGTEDEPGASFFWRRDSIQHGYIVVAPRTLQKPQFWYHADNLQNIWRIIGHLSDHYRIDPRRLIVEGGSGGGMGTWGIATLHPELWAAAASSAGMPPIRPEHVTRLRNLPFFFMHGAKDFIPVAGPRQMHEAMEKQRIEHTYFEHDGGHFPTREQYQRMADWIHQVGPNTRASPRPAVLDFIRQAAEAKPLEDPDADARSDPKGAAGSALNRTPARK